MDATVVAVIGTVVGALVGAGGTLLASHEANRAADRRFRDEQRRRDREELRSAIDGFIGATQHAERVAGERHHSHNMRSQATHDMWVSHKQLTLICSETLRTSADKLADRLNRYMWNSEAEPDPAWLAVHDLVQMFREDARHELNATT